MQSPKYKVTESEKIKEEDSDIKPECPSLDPVAIVTSPDNPLRAVPVPIRTEDDENKESETIPNEGGEENLTKDQQLENIYH